MESYHIVSANGSGVCEVAELVFLLLNFHCTADGKFNAKYTSEAAILQSPYAIKKGV